MQKTKLGVSVGLLGAGICLAIYFGGYIPMMMALGYVLLMEENEWLKKTCIKAAVLAVCFDAVIAVVGLIPDVLDFISYLLSVFKITFYLNAIESLISATTAIIRIFEKLIFLGLGVKALNQGTINMKIIDDFLNK